MPSKQSLELATSGATLPAYLAQPSVRARGAVQMLHEWWGLVDSVRKTCDRFASAGYLALAPDLYHGRVAKKGSIRSRA